MFTRRTVVAAPLALAAVGASPGRSSLAGAAPAFIRYDAASPEGKAMLRTYARGVAAMQALPNSDPRSWTWQWYIHAGPQPKAALLESVFGSRPSAARSLAAATWWTCQAHVQPPENEAYFLAWHRLYLARFEAIVRALTNTPSFTLPYWNYTDPGKAAIPDEFQAKSASDPAFKALYVKDRNKDDGSQFADVNAGEPINKYFQGKENFLTLGDMSAPVYGSATGFNQSLDGNLHGSIHTFVGSDTDMGGIPTAAKDPLFWLHHCNIDRIWYGWGKAGGRNPSDSAWLGKAFTFVDGQGKQSIAAVRTIADFAKLDYSYDTLPKPPKPFVPQAVASNPMHMALRAAAPAMVMAAASTSAASAPAPIKLGSSPQEVTLAPAQRPPAVAARRAARPADARSSPELTAPAPVPAPPAAGERLVMSLNSVQAHAAPGIVYKVYLDLPAAAPPDVAGEHFVGVLNFFDKAMPRQAGSPGMTMGKTVSFDITDVALRVRREGEEDRDFKVTLVPTGAPNEASSPTILGGISITRE